MKKNALASALAIVLGTGTATTEAGTAGLTGIWTGTYSFAMYSPGGGSVGSPTAPQAWSFDFDTGTVSIENTATFYAGVWTAHNVTATDNGDGTYGNALDTGANMIFDWAVSSSPVIEALWEITATGNSATVDAITSRITPDSFVLPFFNPTFTGTLNQVPVPAAAWLFGSGLLVLVSAARGRKPY